MPILLLSFALLFTPFATGAAAVQLPPEVAAYRLALRDVPAKRSGRPVEAVFNAVHALRSALLCEANGGTLLERLSEPEFASLSERLPGVIVSRDEVLIVAPDPVFFAALAEKHGRWEDRAFFRAYLQTFPAGGRPSYRLQQTDVTGCTDFGSGELVARYAGWSAYRTAYPQAYAAEVDGQLAAIEKEVVESTCACRSRAEAVSELKDFLRRFPAAPIAPLVNERLRAIENSGSGIRFDCISG